MPEQKLAFWAQPAAAHKEAPSAGTEVSVRDREGFQEAAWARRGLQRPEWGQVGKARRPAAREALAPAQRSAPTPGSHQDLRPAAPPR